MNATATVAAIVKDERPYLLEWVAWYRLLGFDRLSLYSNDCSDGTDTLLDRMAEAGLVTHHRWPSREDRFFALHDTNDEPDLAALARLPALEKEMARIEAMLAR